MENESGRTIVRDFARHGKPGVAGTLSVAIKLSYLACDGDSLEWELTLGRHTGETTVYGPMSGHYPGSDLKLQKPHVTRGEIRTWLTQLHSKGLLDWSAVEPIVIKTSRRISAMIRDCSRSDQLFVRNV